MSQSQIDSLLKEFHNDGCPLAASDEYLAKNPASCDCEFEETKSALYELILSEVIGEDEYPYTKTTYSARHRRNKHRATQRNKLNKLFGVKENI